MWEGLVGKEDVRCGIAADGMGWDGMDEREGG